MPRVAKPKATGAGAKKPAGAKKKSKLYVMPEPIPLGTVLVDLSKKQWKIGPSIGTGGFGVIYSACKVGEKNYDYVVKCEPHGNGPLFVEMHFYMRNARLEDIERFKKERGMKSLGMPYMLGNGSHDLNGQKHRFIVMPRYGSDVAKFFVDNGRRLPEGTIYRLALQMIDVYEYVHSCGYVHADLKGANILLGYGKNGAAQAYLVDYGLASHYTTKDFKPDPKKMHNGTIEYTSRDAHQGVATMRADFEILCYNLIEWSGVQLPWVRDNLLEAPAKVQKAKEEFMSDVGGSLKKLFQKGVPVSISEFSKYVANMKYNDTPDYERCRKIFAAALKSLKLTNTGDLIFKLKSSVNNNAATEAATTSSKARTKATKAVAVAESSSDDEVICASDDDDTDVIFDKKKTARAAPTSRALKTAPKAKHISPPKRTPPKISPRKRAAPKDNDVVDSTPSTSPSPAKRKHDVDSPRRQTPAQARALKKDANTPASSSKPTLRSTPLSANINFNPSIAVSRSSSSKPGKTIINDHLTPNQKAGKTYEFNFELDVSMDANVVVNVKRKKKPLDANASNRTPTRATSNGSKREDDVAESPATRVKVRKLHSSSSPMTTPAVTVKKTKKFVRSPR